MGKLILHPRLCDDVEGLQRLADLIGATVRITDGGRVVYLILKGV